MTTPQQVLKPCPFCGCEIRLESNRDWHRLQGDHSDNCPFEGGDETLMSPATDEQLELLYRDWNTRAIESATLKAVSGQPVAWRVSSNDEPELGHWLEEVGPDFSDDDGLTYEPLYTLPPGQPAPVDEREAFEAHWTWRKPASECDLTRRDDGTYAHEHVQRHWWTWQCSRAALQGAQAPQATKGQP